MRLRPNIGGDFKVEGSVKIEVIVQEATSLVVLHMVDIITDNGTILVRLHILYIYINRRVK